MSIVLLSCSGTGMDAGSDIARDHISGPISLASAQAELESLVPPAGVDEVLFAGLKQSLSELLAGSGQQRFSAAVPGSPGSRVVDLRVWNNGDGTARCLWTYANEGDYNQDSQVTAGDITPLGQYYDRSADCADWPRACIADGNLDGLVAVTDITPIGQYFGQAVDSYILETTPTPENDASWTEVDTVAFETGAIPAVGGRRQFACLLSAPEVDNYFRAVPYFAGVAGITGDPFQYTGAVEPGFSIEGSCSDSAGSPLAGVQIILGDWPPQLTAVDGSFIFTDLPDGYSAELSAGLTGYIFNPAVWVVAVESAAVSDRCFTGSMLDALETTLPAEGIVNQAVSFELRAVDELGTPVAGFNAEGNLTSNHSGSENLGTLQFIDGIAVASITFPEAGQYTLAVANLAASLDGVIGTISISELLVPELSVTKWQGNATAAISMFFDDGTPDHWTRGLPLWEEFGFRVSLGILKRNFADSPERIPQLQQAFDAGHELANHTTTHPDMTTLTDEQILDEITTCEAFLLESVTGLDRIDSFVYPYEEFNDNVIALLSGAGYIYARSGYQGISDYAQLNDAWSPPFMHLYSWANQAELPLWMWDSTTDWVLSHGDWLIEQCHGIGTLGETGVGWSPRPESEYRAHYSHVKSFGDQLWVAPVREVGGYLVERNNAKFEILDVTSDGLDFILFDALDNSIFNIPLTVRLELPTGWTGVTVRQGLADIAVQQGEGFVLFDVTPGSGTVGVSRN